MRFKRTPQEHPEEEKMLKKMKAEMRAAENPNYRTNVFWIMAAAARSVSNYTELLGLLEYSRTLMQEMHMIAKVTETWGAPGSIAFRFATQRPYFERMMRAAKAADKKYGAGFFLTDEVELPCEEYPPKEVAKPAALAKIIGEDRTYIGDKFMIIASDCEQGVVRDFSMDCRIVAARVSPIPPKSRTEYWKAKDRPGSRLLWDVDSYEREISRRPRRDAQGRPVTKYLVDHQ